MLRIIHSLRLLIPHSPGASERARENGCLGSVQLFCFSPQREKKKGSIFATVVRSATVSFSFFLRTRAEWGRGEKKLLRERGEKKKRIVSVPMLKGENAFFAVTTVVGDRERERERAEKHWAMETHLRWTCSTKTEKKWAAVKILSFSISGCQISCAHFFFLLFSQSEKRRERWEEKKRFFFLIVVGARVGSDTNSLKF